MITFILIEPYYIRTLLNNTDSPEAQITIPYEVGGYKVDSQLFTTPLTHYFPHHEPWLA